MDVPSPTPTTGCDLVELVNNHSTPSIGRDIYGHYDVTLCRNCDEDAIWSDAAEGWVCAACGTTEYPDDHL